MNADVMGGMSCVPGTRVAVPVSLAEAGDEVLGPCSRLTEEQVQAAIEFAQQHPELLRSHRRTRMR